MKVFLLNRNRDFELENKFPSNFEDLDKDLGIAILFTTMAGEDRYILDTVKKIFSTILTDPDEIEYRQEILKDSLNNQSVFREIYSLVTQTIEDRKRNWLGIFTNSISSVFYNSRRLMEFFMVSLKSLKTIADDSADNFISEGWKRFFNMIEEELSDDYFDVVRQQLSEMKFKEGTEIKASPGKGIVSQDFVLLKPEKKNLFSKLLERRSTYTFTIDGRDDAGAKAISEIQDRGLNLIANALAQACDHILSFFEMLRFEIAFYIGCLNLYEALQKHSLPVCFPKVFDSDSRVHSFEELYDICLALVMGEGKKVIGNDLEADYKELFIITGANQGGKSTFLRSIGLSQIMMQCGMFVPARSFRANVCNGIFTHFKRGEDSKMNSGKLEEELVRMSEIIEKLPGNSLILFNESFAATNEREGSEIARQVVNALLEYRAKVFFVTHMFDFAGGFYESHLDDAIFLRAQRNFDGSRTFRIIEGNPLETSYGEDLYQEIFQEHQSLKNDSLSI